MNKTAGLSRANMFSCRWQHQGILKGEFVINCMTTNNFSFYMYNSLNQTSQTGGQQYSDTSPFSIPWQHWKGDLLSKFSRRMNETAGLSRANIYSCKWQRWKGKKNVILKKFNFLLSLNWCPIQWGPLLTTCQRLSQV